MDPCNVVAEIGNVHIGKMDRAKYLIDLAKFAGAHYVKFQKRNPKECVPKAMQKKPHPNQQFAYGKTYLEHREALELTLKQHKELKTYCEKVGIGYATSVWDLTSAKEIISLKPDWIKVPSACATNKKLVDYLYSKFKGDIHISTGMLTRDERSELLEDLDSEYERFPRTVVYHCTSEYPCPFENLFLRELEEFSGYGFKSGFSNHGYGIAADIAAYTLGATWIERHFCDDRAFRHTDAAASLEPDGLRRLCRDLKAVEKALQFKKAPTEGELIQKKKLKND